MDGWTDGRTDGRMDIYVILYSVQCICIALDRQKLRYACVQLGKVGLQIGISPVSTFYEQKVAQ